MRTTQNESWAELQSSLGERQYEVLKEIRKAKSQGITLFELVDALGWPVNNVSGRVTELAKRSNIEESGTFRVNPGSGRKGIVWILKEEEEK